jgi:hypothetical protein
MAFGGTWTSQNKILPGAYINFASNSITGLTTGIRGTVALPVMLEWGASGIIEMNSADLQKNSLNLLGYDYTTDSLLYIRETMKNASKVLVYRLNSAGTKATVVSDNLTITAKYTGTRGNDIKIVIETNVDDTTKFDVLTYLDLILVDMQTVALAEELISNNYVDFSGTGALVVTAGINLTGGTSTDLTSQAYSDFLTEAEKYTFNTIVCNSTETAIKDLYIAFIKRLRDDEGVKCQAVMSDYKADYEGVIVVKNGYKIGTIVIPSENATYYIAGATAGANINESLTNAIVLGATEVDTRYTNSELEQAILNGEIALYQDGDVVRILTDIDSLVTLTEDKNIAFQSNRVIRVLDDIANQVKNIFNASYLGRVTNDQTGRDLFKASLIGYFDELQRLRAIENFETGDIEVLQGNDKKTVLVNVAISVTDSMEKLYMTVTVNTIVE